MNTPRAVLAAADLPARWRSGGRFVLLDTGFDDGERFLTCWQMWRDLRDDCDGRDAVAASPAEVPAEVPAAFESPANDGASASASVIEPVRLPRLHVIALLPRMPSAAEMRGRFAASLALAGTRGLALELLNAWPPATPDFHRLAFDGGRVQLLLVAGALRERLPQIEAKVDAFFIDNDALAHDADPQWPLRLFKAAERLAMPGATLVLHGLSPSVANPALRSGLRTAGFALPEPQHHPQHEPAADTRPDALWYARREAASTRGAAPHRSVGRGFGSAENAGAGNGDDAGAGSARGRGSERHALIVGAGLAGCATAWALAEMGWRSTVVDRHDAPAQEASGNPAGLFHGIVNPQDGAHARFNRAAALEAQRAIRIAIDEYGVPGAANGLLRLHTAKSAFGAFGAFAEIAEFANGADKAVPADPADPADSAAALAAMQAVLQRLALPPDYVQALSTDAASALAGIRLAHPCWHYPGGGWVQPAGLARAFLQRGGDRVRFEGGVAAAALRSVEAESGRPARWQLLGAGGAVLAESATVVLATAGDAAPWLAGASAAHEFIDTERLAGRDQHSPLRRVRGQLSWLAAGELSNALPGLVLPRLPVAGAGYLLPLVDGCAVFGATSQAGDEDGTVRDADHAFNIASLGRLTGLHFNADADAADDALAGPSARAAFQGRTAWRCVADDKLPLIGAVPDIPELARLTGPALRARQGGHTDISQLRRVPRLPGLYTFSALGSRGITWAALGAQVLAATISGAPVPLAAGLLDALDPARFALRGQRRR